MDPEKHYNNFELEMRDEIAIFRINRPKVLNAFNEECWDELSDFMQYADSIDKIKAIILTGAGEKSFVAGADVSSFGKPAPTMTAIKTRSADIACDYIENGTKPVIAAVNGYAYGAGCELAIACDLRVVAENAKFGLPEPNLGLIPGLGGTQRLVRLIGLGRTKEVVLAGRNITGPEAVQMGLAMKCVPQDKLLDEAMEVAKAVLKRAPLAIALSKKLIRHAPSTDISAGLAMEALGFYYLMNSDDRKEGTDAFKNKRSAQFKGN